MNLLEMLENYYTNILLESFEDFLDSNIISDTNEGEKLLKTLSNSSIEYRQPNRKKTKLIPIDSVVEKIRPNGLIAIYFTYTTPDGIKLSKAIDGINKIDTDKLLKIGLDFSSIKDIISRLETILVDTDTAPNKKFVDIKAKELAEKLAELLKRALDIIDRNAADEARKLELKQKLQEMTSYTNKLLTDKKFRDEVAAKELAEFDKKTAEKCDKISNTIDDLWELLDNINYEDNAVSLTTIDKIMNKVKTVLSSISNLKNSEIVHNLKTDIELVISRTMLIKNKSKLPQVRVSTRVTSLDDNNNQKIIVLTNDDWNALANKMDGYLNGTEQRDDRQRWPVTNGNIIFPNAATAIAYYLVGSKNGLDSNLTYKEKLTKLRNVLKLGHILYDACDGYDEFGNLTGLNIEVFGDTWSYVTGDLIRKAKDAVFNPFEDFPLVTELNKQEGYSVNKNSTKYKLIERQYTNKVYDKYINDDEFNRLANSTEISNSIDDYIDPFDALRGLDADDDNAYLELSNNTTDTNSKSRKNIDAAPANHIRNTDVDTSKNINDISEKIKDDLYDILLNYIGYRDGVVNSKRYFKYFPPLITVDTYNLGVTNEGYPTADFYSNDELNALKATADFLNIKYTVSTNKNGSGKITFRILPLNEE